MVIIQLAGGLGNQMFQYALYLELEALGKEVKIDDVSGFVQDAQRKPALAPFGIIYGRPAKKEQEKMLDASMLPWHRVRRKLFGRQKKSYFEGSKLFIPEVLTWDDIYLEGYWQSEKYFQDVREKVREAYRTDRLTAHLQSVGMWGAVNGRPHEAGNGSGITDRLCTDDSRKDGYGDIVWEKSAAQYLDEINSTCSVSVHVRRGDYLKPENQTLFGGICTEAYYREGMRLMRERFPGCSFYLFCNDKDWARETYAGQENITLVDLPCSGEGLTEKDMDIDYAEFVLMSRCKHNILANSSFSWWASYLNPNPDKYVLAPDRWLNNVDSRDFYRADMQKITI